MSSLHLTQDGKMWDLVWMTILTLKCYSDSCRLKKERKKERKKKTGQDLEKSFPLCFLKVLFVIVYKNSCKGKRKGGEEQKWEPINKLLFLFWVPRKLLLLVILASVKIFLKA